MTEIIYDNPFKIKKVYKDGEEIENYKIKRGVSYLYLYGSV